MNAHKRTRSNKTSNLPLKRVNYAKEVVSRFISFFTKQIITLRVLYDRNHFKFVSYSLLLAEVFINLSIVNRIKYTEIDWSTYMQQVECFLNGTLDYNKIYGDTGPIVYPAGHLYIYTILYFLTNRGTNIYFAQHIYIILYLGTLFVIFQLYYRYSKVPPYVLMFMCCTSYRVHSIYVLRLFNDPFAMLFLYLSLLYLAKQKWTIGLLLYSLSVSVKMNNLLFAPALFLVLAESHSTLNVFKRITLCAVVQLVLGLPFLSKYPISYIINSFNVGRVFLHKWTVNYRFVPEHIFVHPYLHIALLALHIISLVFYFRKRWYNLLVKLCSNRKTSARLIGENILVTMFVANFIGIVFARSLHYQFYVWYYHSLPFLLWNTKYKTSTKICILGLIELSWNIFPSTVWSSALLHILHLSILIGLLGHKFTNGMMVVDKIK